MAGKYFIPVLMAFLMTTTAAFPTVGIILDTDFGSDADDLGALAMLHHFIDRDECDLLAVVCWSTEKYAVSAIDAVNRFYSHPDIPIGRRKGDPHVSDWNYSKTIADRFDHTITAINAEEATALYRRILAKSDDQSVVIVTIGPLANIQNLLQSKADTHSPLDGKTLLEKKVKEFVIMGGQFPQGKKEWNFNGDMPGVTTFVIQTLSIPITFSGFEVGAAIRSGAVFNEIDPNTPLYVGFLHFSQNAPWMKKHYPGKIMNNATFDQTAVLYAVENGVGTYWEKITDGYCLPDETGGNKWVKGGTKNQAYLKLKMKPEELALLIETRMLGK